MLQATSGAMLDFLPPVAYPHVPATSFATKFVHVSTNKIRTPVRVVTFMPDGRRLLSCSQNGEFTLWNGMSFNFETILQAHDCAIQAACWSKNENWLLTGDDAGRIKYWQTNLNNLKSVNARGTPEVSAGVRQTMYSVEIQRTDSLEALIRFLHELETSGFPARVETAKFNYRQVREASQYTLNLDLVVYSLAEG